MEKKCKNCKYEKLYTHEEPCKWCIGINDHPNWKPKEEAKTDKDDIIKRLEDIARRHDCELYIKSGSGPKELRAVFKYWDGYENKYYPCHIEVDKIRYCDLRELGVDVALSFKGPAKPDHEFLKKRFNLPDKKHDGLRAHVYMIDELHMINNTHYGYAPWRRIKDVIFNDPATIVFWADGTKTVVKCSEDEVYDPEKGLAMAISKKHLGNQGNYYEEFKKWLPEEEEENNSIDFDGIFDGLNESTRRFRESIKRLNETFENFKEINKGE